MGAAVLVTGLVLLATGCRTTATVSVSVRPNGSGTVQVEVRLDAEAATRVPHLDRLVAVDDLRQGGWHVSGPSATADGGQEVSATKRFADADGATRVLEELSGRKGPLRRFRLQRDRSVTRTRDRLSGTLDFSHGVDALADPALIKTIGGRSLSSLLPGFVAPADPPLDQALRLRLAARLPGSVSARGGERHGHTMVWEVGAGDPPVTVSVQGVRRHTTASWLLLVAAVAAGLFIVSSAWAVVGIRRDRRGRRDDGGRRGRRTRR